jgi:hypothetical protein
VPAASKLTAALATVLALSLVSGAPRARADATGRLTGTATWTDARPGTGVAVQFLGSSYAETVVDPSGHWQSPPLPLGHLLVVFTVLDQAGSTWTVATVNATVTAPDQAPLTATLSGGPATPVLQGLVAGSVALADGTTASGKELVLTPPGGPDRPLQIDPSGRYAAVTPTGTYSLAPDYTFDGLDAVVGGARSVTVSAGRTATVDFSLPARAVTPGAKAAHAARDLGYLNAERARWGLPAGIAEVPIWSQACASHDGYLDANNVLQHPEDPTGRRFSDGGNWAGTHSVLSRGASWTASRNPWEDGPIHLIQLFTPDLARIGIDESRGLACATTWPGIGTPRAPLGTVFTYPGNGTTGLPPSERADENPFVPGQFVGIPRGTVAGRELFVYRPAPSGLPDVRIDSASLSDASGRSVAVRTVDTKKSKVGPYLSGGILIPVHPLRPFTRYTATVRLAATDALPAATHSWSFTTGAANPSGLWPSSLAPRRPGLRLTGLRLVPARVVARRRARFVFRLSAAATVRIVVTRAGRGRTTRVAGATRHVRRGHRSLRLARRLAPGRYRATVSARAGRRVAPRRHVTFRVVRR